MCRASSRVTFDNMNLNVHVSILYSYDEHNVRVQGYAGAVALLSENEYLCMAYSTKFPQIGNAI